MFTKINKKILAMVIIGFILIAVVGFVVYRYTIGNNIKKEMPANQTINTNTDNIPEQKSDVQSPVLEVQLKNDSTKTKGTLTVCSDRCGDGICQSTYQYCQNDDLNCICLESHADCPADCR